MADMRGLSRSRFLPDRIASQIAVLVIMSVAFLHAALLASFLLSRGEARPANPAETIGQLAAVLELLDRTPPAERPVLLTRMAEISPNFEVALAENPPPEEGPSDPRIVHLTRLLGDDFSLPAMTAPPKAPTGQTRFTVGLRDDTSVTVALRQEERPPGPRGGGPLGFTIVFILVSVASLGTWAAFSLTKPLRAIEAAVEHYGPGQAASPLPETGPREIRIVAQAINRMQKRIDHLVNDRTRTLAAIGHDLRTPITRLRLRAELLEDSPDRTRILADLEQMQMLVQSALAHLRDGQSTKPMVLVDLQSLLQTVADSFTDVGQPVDMSAAARPAVRGCALDLERAVGNLLDNALKYGGTASIRLGQGDGMALIDIVDGGPGIPAEQRAAMLEPFVRGEDARSMNNAEGFGLGLTIVRSIMESHGGTISFPESESGGFAVRLALPMA